MKNFDFKKLLVFLVIIAALALVIFFVVKLTSNEKKTSDEETKILEQIGLDYISKLTEGYISDYNGLDLLYNYDETVTYETLTPAMVLHSATKYIINTEMNNAVSTVALEKVTNDVDFDASNYTAFNGEAIRQAIKELYGVDFTDTSAMDELGFTYNYYYDSNYDIYLKGINSQFSGFNYDNGIRYYVVKTVKDKKEDSLKMEFAVAFTHITEEQKMDYAKEATGETIIVTQEIKDEFPKDKVDEFEKYTITLKKDGDNYVFDSFKKGSI